MAPINLLPFRTKTPAVPEEEKQELYYGILQLHDGDVFLSKDLVSLVVRLMESAHKMTPAMWAEATSDLIAHLREGAGLDT